MCRLLCRSTDTGKRLVLIVYKEDCTATKDSDHLHD